MDSKLTLGIVFVIVIALIGYFFLTPAAPQSAPAPLAAPAATSTPKSSSEPTFKFGTPTLTTLFIRFDANSLTSTSTYPTITGTANVSRLRIVIFNDKDVGLVGTSDISVENGRWSYSVPIALEKGSYKVAAASETGGSATAKLTIN